MTKRYHLVKNLSIVDEMFNWDSTFWVDTEVAHVDNFHHRSSAHRPLTEVKLQFNDDAIFVLFKVVDKFVLAINDEYNSKVNHDSCVEWFVRPPLAEGYYNFELNAIGTLHVNYIVDPERDEKGKRKDIRLIPEEHAKKIVIHSTFNNKIINEIQERTTWFLGLKIPFEFFELHSPIKKVNGSIWQGNLYKCGDKTSHPHWAAWSPVIELNFHQPKHFGEFIFNA